ncbi:DUF4886 domain-containing protein [Stratiformator vulcanicus]|uniref:DUF4886 domain-containing protein n=1 Tax=Stratiformator vulcanicus TaxID=2527980 RepID=A0A517R7R8_9PLAN|nr:DUF4886 domain-containing protein [Stratiformator vulcanicus]QDT39939.1 hypothetical protein Pan189_43510 [Stratiformator vulcanicus]
MLRSVFCGLTLILAGQVVAGETTSDAEPIKILTIGNSFANNATSFLDEIGDDAGTPFVIGKANIGGGRMEQHASALKKALTDPEDREGRRYRRFKEDKQRFNLIERLQADDWDYVTIQQFSAHSFRPETFEPHGRELIEAVRKYAPDAEILVLESWAYRADHEMFQDGSLNQQSMYEGLHAAYNEFADRYDLRVIPIGTAFQKARAMPNWRVVVPDPDFDYSDTTQKSLPNERGSLVVGSWWRRNSDTGEKKLGLDAKHANDAGCYLGGCTIYELTTGNSAVEIDWKPDGLSQEQAESLREAAHQAIEESASVVVN